MLAVIYPSALPVLQGLVFPHTIPTSLEIEIKETHGYDLQ